MHRKRCIIHPSIKFLKAIINNTCTLLIECCVRKQSQIKTSAQSQSIHKKSMQNCTSKGCTTPSNLTPMQVMTIT